MKLLRALQRRTPEQRAQAAADRVKAQAERAAQRQREDEAAAYRAVVEQREAQAQAEREALRARQQAVRDAIEAHCRRVGHWFPGDRVSGPSEYLGRWRRDGFVGRVLTMLGVGD